MNIACMVITVVWQPNRFILHRRNKALSWKIARGTQANISGTVQTNAWKAESMYLKNQLYEIISHLIWQGLFGVILEF